MQKKSNRIERINEELKKEISNIISFELKNSNITGLISITRVDTTPDLKFCKVFVSVLNAKSLKNTMQGLQATSKVVRAKVANRINLRSTPEISFEIDDSMEHGDRIEQLLKQIREDSI